jgi:8-amino-7-oxononanoate synthase
MIDLVANIRAALVEREQQQRMRTLKNVAPVDGVEVSVDGQSFFNFSGNDYLGLSQHPYLKEKAIEFAHLYGVGCGASRLLSGNHFAYETIERQLAQLKGTEAALIFSTGYQLNLTVPQALASLSSSFICDRLCHNSILVGATLANRAFTRFKHNDVEDLREKLIRRDKPGPGWIVTESVFGMDGDLANLPGLIKVAKEMGQDLFVDEAHATGVFGENGMGLACNQKQISLIMGTFGKACGSFGAYVACTKEMRDYLINFCPGFIYTTALPPPVLGAIHAALEIIPTLARERRYLLDLADYARRQIKSLGFDVGASASQIIPVIVGDDAKALDLAEHLERYQILAPAIRPPTVPVGTARLRISLSAIHKEIHIEKLLQALKVWSSRR